MKIVRKFCLQGKMTAITKFYFSPAAAYFCCGRVESPICLLLGCFVQPEDLIIILPKIMQYQNLATSGLETQSFLSFVQKLCHNIHIFQTPFPLIVTPYISIYICTWIKSVRPELNLVSLQAGPIAWLC